MAKKDNGKAAKRAAKKHAKEVKRRREVAARGRGAPDPQRPDHAWRPAREGIEGLARRMRIGTHSAAQLADHLHAHHGRRDAAEAWLPSKVGAMDMPTLLAALGERGIMAEEGSFRVLAEAHLSARRLAEVEWHPRLTEAHGVHDRDLCGEAAERLWGEWCPEIFSDERLDDDLHAADLVLQEEGVQAGVEAALAVWNALGADHAARLESTAQVMRFVNLLDDAVLAHRHEGALDEATREAMAGALLRLRADLVGDVDRDYRLSDMIDELHWTLGRGDDVLDRMLGTAASTGDPVTALDAAALLLEHHDATARQIDRVRTALGELQPNATGDLAEDIALYLADLDEALIAVRTG